MKWIVPCMLSLAIGCGGAAASAGHFDVVAPLASIDPGPSVALVLDVPGPERAALVALPDTIENLETYADQERRSASSLEPSRILRAALLLEARVGASCDFRCARSLATLYGLLVRTRDVSESVLALDPMLAPLQPRIAERHRWATASALRETTDPHLRAELLLAHAVALVGASEHARSLEDAALLALAEASSDASDADASRAEDMIRVYAARARTCYALGDASCGDADLAAMRSLGASATRLERPESARDAAAVVRATEGDASIDAQLRRADALIVLDARPDARAIFESLLQSDPTDARPHARLALLEFERVGLAIALGVSIEDISAHLRAASWLENRDRAYYELRTIMWQFETMRALGAAEADGRTNAVGMLTGDIDAIVSGLTETNPGTAAAFRVWAEFLLRLLAGGTAAIEADAQQTAHDAISARATYPSNVDLARVALMFGVRSSGESTRAAVANPLPELADVTASIRYLAAVHWSDPSLLPDTARDPELAALLLAERARQGETAWTDVVTAYRALLAGATAADRARLANGLAVALFAAGQTEEARTTIASVEGDLAALNRLAIQATTPAATNWLDAVRRLRDESTTPHVACLATGLLVHFGAEPTSARDARCGDVRRHVGADLNADTLFSFDYSRSDGLRSTLRVPLTVWLLAEVDPEGW